MRGGKFLSLSLLEKLWQEFGDLVIQESRVTGLSAWLKSRNPLWHTVGRVTFHLADNKRDPDRPFAFLATYTHRLSQRGKPQHLPLARALQEYGGTKNKAALTALLSPVHRAAEKSDPARELVETRRLFQALAWTPEDAHRFLRQVPAFEESGLLVRVPDWWKSGRPARPQVNVRIGDTDREQGGRSLVAVRFHLSRIAGQRRRIRANHQASERGSQPSFRTITQSYPALHLAAAENR
jgi:non-specific serine/threonine protein kinase